MEIGLVLGAGGARGLAHIGAVRALKEAGFEPSVVLGVSMGGIIGAMVAAGHDPDTMVGMVTDRSRLTLPSPGKRGGILEQQRLIELFCADLPDDIEDLKLRYAVVAVDILKGEPVILDRGPLKPALAATIAIPGVLSPVMIDGRPLVDGGAMNALPVDIIRSMTAAPVVAVDVTPARDRHLSIESGDSFWKRLWSRLTFRRRPLTIDLFLKAFSLQQSLLNEARIANFPPDVYVFPELDSGLRLEDFHRAEETIESGYQSTKRALEQSDVRENPHGAEKSDSS